MASKNIKIILIVILLIVLLIAFATKSAFWDNVTWKTGFKNFYDEVGPAIEGLIAMDVILFLTFFLVLIFTFKHQEKNVYLIICVFLALALVVRFILSMMFLVGNDEWCKKQIDSCKNYPYNWYCDTNHFKSLKAAWIFEIIAVILVTILSILMIFLLHKHPHD